MCVNGCPDVFRNENYMSLEKNGYAAHMGGWVAQRCIIACYKYVVDKYNLAKDGCFVIGRSMGGLTSLNLAQSGTIPVIGVAIDAPVISAFKDAYFNGGWSSGNLNGRTPAIFAWIYQWDYCNFTDNTYTIPKGTYTYCGHTYNVSESYTKNIAELQNNTQDMIILWFLNRNKMVGYDAYKTGQFIVKNIDEDYIYNENTDNDDKYMGIKFPCPVKIWHGKGDNTNQIAISKRFVQILRNGGSIASLRSCPTNTHCVWNVTKAQDNVADISVQSHNMKCSPYAVELCNFIDNINI